MRWYYGRAFGPARIDERELMKDRAAFTLESAFRALRPFVLNGRRLNYEDPVDTAGIEPRRLRQMWEARLIDVSLDAPSPRPAEKATAKRVSAKAAQPPTSAPKDNPAPVAPPQAQRQSARLVYAQFGKYDVVASGGEVVAKGLTKPEAEEVVRRYG